MFVTDRVDKPKQIERVLAFDAQSGKEIWKHEYDCVYSGVGYVAGPRASVSIDEGRAFSLGTMGHLFALDTAKGDVLWQKDLLKEYKIRMPIWGIAASPLVTGDLVIVQIGGEDGACLVAFDKRTGAEKWRAMDDDASYSAPILIQQAGKTVLVCWTGHSVAGLDPVSGKVYWRHPIRDADGHLDRHAGAGAESAVRQFVLRRLADAQAGDRRIGGRTSLAPPRPG